MTFQGLEFTDSRPFKDCLIHGLIRDKEGRKMSKSLGNGVDPMDVIKEYGCDSLRFFLSTSSAPGMDLRYDEEKVKSTWNFFNKIWNASRFVLMNIEDLSNDNYDLNDLSNHDKWILSKLNKTIKEVKKYMDKYQFNNAGNVLYDFIWDSFCDSYIEMSKSTSHTYGTKSTLLYVLSSILKMLHPFAPYVTEEIYQMLPLKDAESIMISSYPEYNKKFNYDLEYEEIESVISFIKEFRFVSSENNIPKTAKVKINNEEDYTLIKFMLRLEERLTSEEMDKTNYNVNYNKYSMTIYYDKVETEADKILREKQIKDLEASIARREKLLSNEAYTSKAPSHIVEADRKKLEEEKEKLKTLKG